MFLLTELKEQAGGKLSQMQESGTQDRENEIKYILTKKQMYTKDIKSLKAHYLEYWDKCPALAELYINAIEKYELQTKKDIRVSKKLSRAELEICK